MAYTIPSIDDVVLAGVHRGERETLRRLRSGLGPEFTVYHGVHWTRARQSRTAYGEVDFVVVNRDGRILVIEQKNGPLDETPDGLEKSYREGVTNVQTQIRRSVDAIKEKFRAQGGGTRALSVDYLFYCPDYRVKRLDAAGLDKDRIVDAPRSGDLAGIITRILEPGTGANDGFTEDVHRFFRQTFDLVPDVHAYVGAQERSFSRLNAELVDTLDSIEMSPLRLRVKGVAGCGKTGIAVRFYERAVQAGKRPLMVCFNRPLREKLNAVVPNSGLVQTWNGFCGRFLEDCGAAPDYERMFREPNFWTGIAEQVAERAIGSGVPEKWKFDSLVVDEAQDFEPEWYEILRLFLRSNHDILWLEDPDQNIRRTAPPDERRFVGWRARRNYRSPRNIARFIRSALEFNFESASDLPGLGVKVSTYDDPVEQAKLAAKRVADLVGRRFRHTDVTLLTMRGIENSALSGVQRLGSFTVRRFTNEYDLFGNQKMSNGQIHFDSIRRFKGQQAPAIILCDVDPDPSPHWQRLLYCGMTRATVRLELLVKRSNPHCERLLAASR